jgi:hypothetical protein
VGTEMQQVWLSMKAQLEEIIMNGEIILEEIQEILHQVEYEADGDWYV